MKFLSKLFITGFLTSIVLVSCDVSDDGGNFQSNQVSAILEANVPDTMMVGETYPLEITYQKDSDCHTFFRFEAVNQGDSLYFVRAMTTFTQAADCSQDPEGVLIEEEFTNNFESDFKFKFLTDIDSIGEPVYIDREVVVIEE